MKATVTNSLRATALIVCAFLCSGCSMFGVQSLESPAYTVLSTEGGVEVRQYQTMVVVETSAGGTLEDAQDEIFMRLFRYISGNNEAASKLSMTSPVALTSFSEELSPGVLSLSKARQEGWTMHFVLPAQYTVDSAPQPKDPAVRLRELAPRRTAALGFTGRWTEGNIDMHKNELLVLLAKKGMAFDEQSLRFAAYNPPWTIPWLRRNEIQVDLNNQ